MVCWNPQRRSTVDNGTLTVCPLKVFTVSPLKVKVKVKLLSHVWLFATPWTVAYQAPPSMGFSRQKYRSGLPFPSSGDLPNPGIKPGSPALQTDALPSEPPGKPFSSIPIQMLGEMTNICSHRKLKDAVVDRELKVTLMMCYKGSRVFFISKMLDPPVLFHL